MKACRELEVNDRRTMLAPRLKVGGEGGHELSGNHSHVTRLQKTIENLQGQVRNL